MSDRSQGLAERYVRFLQAHAGKVITVCVVLTALGAWSASRFELRTNLAELLPQDEPSIRDLEHAKTRVGGISHFIVAVKGDQFEENRRLVDDLVARYQRLPDDLIMYMKHSVQEESDFYSAHKHLFADLGDLEEVLRRLQAKIRYERIKNNPVLNLDLDGEPLQPVGFDLSDLRAKYEQKSSSYNRYVDGYLTGEDGRLLVILMYPPGVATGVDFGRRMLREIRQATAEVCLDGPVAPGADLEALLERECPRKYGPSVRVGFTGTMVTAIVEQDAIIDDILLVTCLCVSLNLLLLLLYFRTLRVVPIVGTSLAMGTIWTFGISIFIVDHLNTSTAFLASIIVGNGINFGLIQYARFLEERRAGRSLDEALVTALRVTSRATLAAALAAGIAYGSLIITSFRGFNGFGYMGGLGMVLCWLSAFSVQPALVVLLERLRAQNLHRGRAFIQPTAFVKPLARLVTSASGWILAVAILASGASLYLGWRLVQDPFEYDFRNLRNQAARTRGAGALSSRVDGIFPSRLDPSFILADRPDQVPLVHAELARNNASGPFRNTFHELKTIYSYLPEDQEKKVEVLGKIRKALSDSTLSWLDDEQRADVEKYRPPEGLRPLVPEDLPQSITRVFTELDGRMGLAILLYPSKQRSVWDGHFLIELSHASRLVHLPDGTEVRSAGVGTVFAEMIRAMERDGPLSITASLLGVMLLVVLLYRSFRRIGLMLITLFFGSIWTVGLVQLLGEKLNFLNFIALPITFGIGIDYAVNLYSRYRQDGEGSIAGALVHTGGAVALCSLTTLIGYSSLLIADNRALVSFGLLSILGELTSLSAALLALPAILVLLERRRARLQSQGDRVSHGARV